MKYFSIIVSIITLLTFQVNAQDQTVEQRLAVIMNLLRQTNTLSTDAKKLVNQSPESLLEQLAPYENDTSPKIRHFTYTLCKKISDIQGDITTRQIVTSKLVNALADSSPLVWQHAAKDLLSFHPDDFTEESKQTIHSYLSQDNPKYEIILIVGTANMTQSLPRLISIANDQSNNSPITGKWCGTSGWAAHLSSARLGHTDSTQYCIEKVSSEPNPVIQVTKLLKDMAYIRQKEAILFIKTYLDSNDRLPSLKANVSGTQYAQYAIDLLAECIINIPIERKYVGAYTPSEISNIRQWMNQESNWLNFINK
jgi:hypothetical protein